jgi:alkylation response protein AidB-like acyl-CoA dehydrogenase
VDFSLSEGQEILKATARDFLGKECPISLVRDMEKDEKGSRYLTYQAAWRLSQGLPCAREVAMARACVSEAANRTCLEACHLHGAIGYTQDCDIQLYLRQVKAAGLDFGSAVFHSEEVARQRGL